ncbi:MAG: sensor histidine kinase [Lachnospiraceae bacterium]
MKPKSAVINFFLHDMKLKYKFLFTHLILIMLPTVLLSFILFSQMSDIVTNKTLHTEEALVTQTSNTVAATVAQAIYTNDTITQNQFFSELLGSQSVTSLAGKESFATQSNTFLSTVNSLVDHAFITDIQIYVSDDHLDLCSYYDSIDLFRPLSDAKGSYWYGIFQGSDQNELLCPSFYLTTREITDNGKLAYIKKFSHIATGETVSAYIAVYFSQDSLTEILHQNMTTPNSVSYLVNSRNSIVSTTDSALSGTYFQNYDSILKTAPDKNDFVTKEILGERLYLGYRPVSGTDWYLVSVIPVNSVFSEANGLFRRNVVLYAFVLIFGTTTALFLSNSIVKRISYVISTMSSAREGVPHPINGQIEADEIGQLITTYNYMVSQLNNLMQEQTRIANELKVSEFKALQAQINPHFLYNMLDMINWLSKDGKQNEVSEAVQALSKYYKLTLNKGNIITTISEELDHVSLYVKLQNMRYEDKIRFIIDIPDEILDYEIPKLILQPIVENAILHGIFEKENKEGIIVIASWMEGQNIQFTISDNGNGIPPDKLPAILTGEGKSTTGSNIAIYNTHLRLKLLYGDNFGLHYESVLGKGTDVTIRIPAILYQE